MFTLTPIRARNGTIRWNKNVFFSHVSVRKTELELHRLVKHIRFPYGVIDWQLTSIPSKESTQIDSTSFSMFWTERFRFRIRKISCLCFLPVSHDTYQIECSFHVGDNQKMNVFWCRHEIRIFGDGVCEQNNGSWEEDLMEWQELDESLQFQNPLL